MMILNQDYIKQKITNDGEIPVPFRWSHGSTDSDLGDGLLIYSLIQFTRSKNCVCIGSGGGFVEAYNNIFSNTVFDHPSHNYRQLP